MSTEPERDTVKDAELIVSVLGGDIDRVNRTVLAALALAAVVVTQIPLSHLLALPEAFRVLTVIAVGLLSLAAVILFYYTQKLNHTRLTLAQAALEDPPPNMHARWNANFGERDADTSRYVWPFRYGIRLLGAGGLLLGVVVARLLLG